MPTQVETRDVLAPHVGHFLRFRGVAERNETVSHGKQRRTFVRDLDAWIGGGWVRASHHVWVYEHSLCKVYGVGAVVEFDAKVSQYTSRGSTVVRYGVTSLRNVVRVADADAAMLVCTVRDLIAVFGWAAVADVVAAEHVTGEHT